MTEEEKDEYMLLMAKEFANEMNTALVSKFLPMEYVAAVSWHFWSILAVDALCLIFYQYSPRFCASCFVRPCILSM